MCSEIEPDESTKSALTKGSEDKEGWCHFLACLFVSGSDKTEFEGHRETSADDHADDHADDQASQGISSLEGERFGTCSSTNAQHVFMKEKRTFNIALHTIVGCVVQPVWQNLLKKISEINSKFWLFSLLAEITTPLSTLQCDTCCLNLKECSNKCDGSSRSTFLKG